MSGRLRKRQILGVALAAFRLLASEFDGSNRMKGAAYQGDESKAPFLKAPFSIFRYYWNLLKDREILNIPSSHLG
ncbi:MAG TPA: hypothetical protein VGJ33_10790 [Candidatus Angelobacter sp.]|jgi:hypothetical protein